MRFLPLWSALACACAAWPAAAADDVQVDAAELPPISVRGHYQNGVGTSNAASEGSVTAGLIAHRPALRPAEILEFVPGMIVTQHSGDGKANQYFLRGFNLDHGTDFASFVDGMPVNMVSHAHGQGYSDLNFLIPELVDRIDYRKGTYFAGDGDFAATGSARIQLAGSLPRGLAQLTWGERGYRRALLADSTALGSGTLLGAAEVQGNDGPWEQPENLHKLNGWLRYSDSDSGRSRSVTLMAYHSRWTSTDQIPARAVADGSLGRFGSLDPSDGGATERISLSAQQRQALGDGEWRASAYAIRSRLNLYSDFTYFQDDPVHGDQFEQAERRTVIGGEASRRWTLAFADRQHEFTVGGQLRHDRLSPVGLYATEQRQRLAVEQESRVRQTQLGLYGELQSPWTSWLRSVVGLRGDMAHFEVDSRDAANSGRASDTLASPKFSLVLGPWRRTEFFVNLGNGFHSNDARGVTAGTDPVPGLVRARGREVGARTEWVPGLQSSLALWELRLDSELVYVGDAGTTEPNRASRRHGVEWNNHWLLDGAFGPVARGWLLDVDVAASQSRYRDESPVGNRVPGAVDRVFSAGLSWADERTSWSGHVQLRHFGPRDLNEDASLRTAGTTLCYLRAGYRFSRRVSVNLDVFNLFDRQASDIDYAYASQRLGEPTPVLDRHFHPVEPRTVRLTLAIELR